MPTPLPQMLPQIVTLNVETEPFSYYAQGTQILGWWDIVRRRGRDPLFGWLESHGWRHGSFLGKLFAH